jgi:hypothetical protein
MSWSRTVIGFWIGSVAAGAVIFSIGGLIGTALGLDSFNPWFGTVVIATAAILDLARIKPLGPKRQVDEDWLGSYRDWVVGFGYGAQLGLGFVTIIPTWGTWAVFLVGASLGLPVATIMGVAFGVGRSLLLFSTRTISSPTKLSETMRRFAGAESRARWIAMAGYAVVILTVGFNVV